MIEAEYKSEARITKDNPQLTLTGDWLGVCCEDFIENWPYCKYCI